MTIQEREELVGRYLKERKDLGQGRTLARVLLEEHPEIGLTFNAMRRWLERFIKRAEIINVNAPEVKKYTVTEDGLYIWKGKFGQVSLSVEFVDQLFYEYSEHGLNLSQTEIMNKHNLQPWEWTSIKNTLWLYKKANIFSPYTVEQTPPEELSKMIEEKMNKLFANTGYQVEQQYHKALNKKYKEAIRKQTEKDLEIQSVVAELHDLIPECKVKPAISIKKDGNGTINVFLFDLHFGAESRENPRLPVYSPELTRKYLAEIATEVNKYNAENVHVFLGGDMIETFTGLNHIDSWRGIAKGYYGSKIVIEAYQVLLEFIGQMNNVRAIYGVPGNHDRATEKKENDGVGWIAIIIYEMLRIALSKFIDVHYDEKIISVGVDGIQYIMSHGDKKLTNMPAAELILEYGDPYAYNLLVSGHWHERKVKKDHKNFRQLVCPSIFPGNDYSIDSGYSTCPGFIIVQNRNSKPTVTDYSL